MGAIGSTTIYTTFTTPIVGTKVYSPSLQPSDPTVDWYGEEISITVRYQGETNFHWGIELFNGTTWLSDTDPDTVYYRTSNLFSASETTQTIQHTVDPFLIPAGYSIRFWVEQYLIAPQAVFSPLSVAASNDLGTGTWSAYLTADAFATAQPTSPIARTITQNLNVPLTATISNPNNATGLTYRIQVYDQTPLTLLSDTGDIPLNGTQIANGLISIPHSAANFPVLFTNLTSSSSNIYQWRIQISGTQNGDAIVGAWSSYQEFIFSVANHIPTVSAISVSTSAQTGIGVFSITASDALGHELTSIVWSLEGYETTSSDPTANLSVQYPNDFGSAPLLRNGEDYSITVRVTCAAGRTATRSASFTVETVGGQTEVVPLAPLGEITTLEPEFTGQFFKQYSASSMDKLQIQVFHNGIKIADTGEMDYSDLSISHQYTPDNFFQQYEALQFGQSYTWRMRAHEIFEYTGGVFREWSPYTTPMPFSIAPYAPVVGITAPNSGGFDLEPQFVGTYQDSLGFSRDETEWKVYHGNTLIGETVIAYNNLSPQYDGNPSTWLTYTPLEYGETYVIQLRAKSSVNVWSSLATRTFTVAPYTPIATLVEPATTKIDTLSPTISGIYESAVENSKQAHKFLIYNIDGVTKIAEKTVTNATSPFESVYTNDGSWSTYGALQWQTPYIFIVMVQDEEDIWSSSGSDSPGRRVIRTDSYPLSPINLFPNGEDVATLQPLLSAQFVDPDAGDTPSVMEVELREISTGTLKVQRTEADNDQSFSVFLSDNLVVNTGYTWRTRFQDQAGLQGPWSQWATFSTKQGAVVILTNPSANEILDSPIQTFTWTYSHPNGVAQGSGRLRIYPATGNQPIYDSGTVVGSYVSQVIPNNLLNNETSYRIRVDATDENGDVASTGIQFFTTDWEGPPQPNNPLLEVFNDAGFLTFSWDETDTENFEGYRIYKRDILKDTSWVFVDEIFDVEQTTYDYYFAASGRTFDFAVSVVSSASGVALESSLEEFVSATMLFPNDTWLNDAFDPSTYQVKLQRNPNRSSSYERDSVLTQAIGRQHPALHVGKSYESEIETTFQIPLPYTDIAMIESIIQRGGTVLYRDGRGRREWVALRGYKVNDKLPNKGELNLNIPVIGVKDR